MARDEADDIPLATRTALFERCGGQCEFCFDKGVQVHHRKYRSLAPKDPLLHDLRNLDALCPFDHERTHRGDPEMSRYRTLRWQKIGETEADIK